MFFLPARFSIILFIASLMQSALSASHLVGIDVAVELPKSAEWNMMVNFRPGNGETVNLNPPRFSWSYAPDPSRNDAASSHRDVSPHEFIFQISSNKSFTDFSVNVRTPWNMYNTLAPLVPGGNYFWRIGYIYPRNPDDPNSWTLSTNGWKDSPSVWITNSFSISSNATSWDRSMLANPDYLAARGKHPHILFNADSRTNLLAWLNGCYRKNQVGSGTVDERKVGQSWDNALKTATQTISSPWWQDSKPMGGWDGNWGVRVGEVAFVAAVTGSKLYNLTNLANQLDLLAAYFRTNGGPTADIAGGGAGQLCIYRSIVCGYDWFYDVLTPAQRYNCLRAIELRSAWGLYSSWFTIGLWGGPYSTNVNYPGPFSVRAFNAGKLLNNHPMVNSHYDYWGALAAYNDSPICRKLFDAGVNYMIGVGMATGGFEGGMGDGRSYLFSMLFNGGGLDANFFTYVWYGISFPEAKLNLNPFWSRNAEWFSWMWPVGYTQGHDGWGDVGWGNAANPWLSSYGKYLAGFTGNSIASQHSKAQRALSGEPGDSIVNTPILYYYPPPSSPASNVVADFFPHGGWAFGSTFSPNSPACYSNGVGFIFQARPGGCQPLSHSHFSDLSFDLWAYGSTITDAGSDMTYYGKDSMSHYCLLVNGYGTMQPWEAPLEPSYSRIIGYTNSTDYTYVAADATLAYPHKKFAPEGWLVAREAYADLSFVTKVQRHILFPHGKYFVIFDSLESRQPATFSWLYHVLEDTVTNLNEKTVSFEYTSNIQKLLGSKAKTTDVRVLVQHIFSPDGVTITNLTGTNVTANPVRGGNYWDASDKTHPRAHALWVSNQKPSTNWHFLTVIYPIKPGDKAPAITRITDRTVRIQNGDEDDIVSWGETNRNPQSTFIVDTVALEGSK
jgi:hypothetical protein